MEKLLKKKKRIIGLSTGAIFVIWVLMEFWLKWQDWAPYWDQISWAVEERLMARSAVLKLFMEYIGYSNLAIYASLMLLSLACFCTAIWGTEKKRLNVFAVVALFIVFAVDTFAFIAVLKKVITLPEGAGASLVAVLYALAGIGSTIVWFLVFVTAVVSATGNSFLKKAWFLNGLLYLLWAIAYYFIIPAAIAFVSTSVVLSDAITSASVMRIFFAGGIVAMGYWISLYMPSKDTAKTIGAYEIDDAWDMEDVHQSQYQNNNANNHSNNRNNANNKSSNYPNSSNKQNSLNDRNDANNIMIPQVQPEVNNPEVVDVQTEVENSEVTDIQNEVNNSEKPDVAENISGDKA